MKLPFRPGMRRSSFEIDMTNGPLVGKIIRFAIPLALSGILQLLFNAADIIVVGQFVGPQALAAVGSTSALIQLDCQPVYRPCPSASTCWWRGTMAAGQHKDLRETVHTAVLVSVICGDYPDLCGHWPVPAPAGADGHPRRRDRPGGAVHAHLLCGHAGDDALQLRLGHPAGGGGYPAAPVLLADCRASSTCC